MQSTQLRMEPLAYHLAVANDHGTDQGIRAYAPASALGKGERAAKELVIGG